MARRGSRLSRGKALFQLSRYNEAIAEFELGLSEDEPKAILYLMIGYCYLDLQNQRQAIVYAEKSLAEGQEGYLPFFLLASAYEGAKDYHKARLYILKAIAIDPEVADMYSLLADIYVKGQNIDKAVESAMSGLALNPSHIRCNGILLTAAVLKRNRIEFEGLAKKLLALDPNNDYVHALIGWGKMRFNNYEGSLEHYRESLRINPMRQDSVKKMEAIETIRVLNGDKPYTSEDYVFTVLAFITIVAFARIALDVIFYLHGD